ncbi:TOBE domain-containing protein [Derxia gummosa]|uniref:TOBE domain-containing protein n=1 Tax=Derxia gummosa DSM 723 TaxID=1121388 RepID=A0A8B6X6K9_9BURK|nr:TOBE domain-containing protein [Derxia gummosa]
MPSPTNPDAKPLLFATQLFVERDGQELVGPRRFELLRQIAEGGSISAAAQAVGISYRSAWGAIDALNNLAGEPIVERSKGGVGGGGATLTAAGRTLLDTYAALQAKQQEFLDWVASGGNDMQHWLGMLSRLSMRMSARNQLAGVVERIDLVGPQASVQLRLANAQSLRALVSRLSLDHLGLDVGAPAIAVFKSSAASAVGPDALVPARANRLEGHLAETEHDAGRVEMTLALPGGLSVFCLQEAVDEAALPLPGTSLIAVFDPSVVLLAASH